MIDSSRRPPWVLPSLLAFSSVLTFNDQALAQAPAQPGSEAPDEEQPTASADPYEDLRAELAELRRTIEAPSPSSPLTGLGVSGYVQGQYESHEDSRDQMGTGSNLLNRDRFLLRRARLKVAGDWKWAGALLELNGSTTGGGFGVSVRRAEASLRYRPDDGGAPLVEGAIGVMDQPFGFELLQSSRERLFMERSLVVRSLFPSPADVGARVGGTLDWFHWALAVMNGEPQGEKIGFPGGDPNGAKDLFLRVGAHTRPTPSLRISGDVSVLQGKGFHQGSPGTKERLEWRDLNEDGIAQAYEYTPIPATAATPSANFDRWAVGADVQIALDTSLGTTALYGEMIYGENLDRLHNANDPVVTGLDAREFGWYVAVTQDIGSFVKAGFRYDVYEPDSNTFDKRQGQLLPASSKIETFSPVVALELPDTARLSLQYDIVRDHLARASSGVPADLANDVLTLRLQVQM